MPILVDREQFSRDVRALAIMMIAFPFYQSLVTALVPLLMNDLTLSETTVGFVQAIPGIFVLLLGAPVARLANTRYRRATQIIGMGLCFTSAILYSFAKGALGLVVPQLMMGIGTTIFYAHSLSTSFRLATGHEQHRVQGLLTAFQGIGYFAGPLVGGYISRFGYDVGFYAGALVAGIGLVATTQLTPSQDIEPSAGLLRDLRESYGRLYRVLTQRPTVLLGAAYVFMDCFLLYVMGGSFFLIYASRLGLSTFLSATLMGGRDAVGAVVRLPFALVTRHVHSILLLGVGTILGALTIAVLPLAEGAVGLALIALGLGVAVAFLPPAVNMLSGASAAPVEQSFAVVSLNVSNFAAQTTLAPLVGFVLLQTGYARGYPIIGLTWAGLAVLLLIQGLRLKRNGASAGQEIAAEVGPS